MKIGVITDCFKKPHAEGIQLAGKLGLSGVQIYATKGDFSPATLTPEQKFAYKKLLADNNLVVSALCADMGGFGFERAEDNPIRVNHIPSAAASKPPIANVGRYKPPVSPLLVAESVPVDRITRINNSIPIGGIT